MSHTGLKRQLEKTNRENRKLKARAMMQLLENLGLAPDSPTGLMLIYEYRPADVDDYSLSAAKRWLVQEMETEIL